MADDTNDDMNVFSGTGRRYLAALAISIIVLFVWQTYYSTPTPQVYTINYTQFMDQLNAGNVNSVSIKKLQVNGELKKDTDVVLQGEKQPSRVRYFQSVLPVFQGDSIMAKLGEEKVAVTVESADQGLFWQFVIGVLPWVLIIGIWVMMMRKTQQLQGGPGGLFSFGASRAKLYKSQKTNVTFKDVAGMDSTKLELRETIEYLKDPVRFEKLGAKVPKGVLLIGPPGTGKTLLARATDGEAGVPFYNISASEFIEMFVGVGASRVRDMFKKAKETHPSIIFIDEIDAVGRTRGTGLGGGHDEREQTLNQLLSEMDGFDPHDEVIVMAATNRPDVLDPALLRPGRFDRHIVLDRPGWKERKAILEIHVRNKTLGQDVDLDTLARGTPGMTGADL